MDYHWEAQRVGPFLEEQARRKHTVCYSEVVADFAYRPLDGAWRAHPLSHIFDVLDREDAESERPFRTALVVSKDGPDAGRPGPGFYEALQTLRRIPNVRANWDQVWTQELNALFAYYSPRARARALSDNVSARR